MSEEPFGKTRNKVAVTIIYNEPKHHPVPTPHAAPSPARPPPQKGFSCPRPKVAPSASSGPPPSSVVSTVALEIISLMY